VIDTTFGLDGTGTVLSNFLAEATAIAIDHNQQIVVAGMQKIDGHSRIIVAWALFARRTDPVTTTHAALHFIC